MGIFYGLIAAIFWGLGDFCARYVTHRIGTYRTLCYLQFVGIFGLTIYLLLTGELQHLFVSTGWQPWLWALLAALLNIVSSLALYRAFEVGTLSLVSPIAASYAVVTVVLAFLSGEVLTGLQNLAIVLVLLGVIACSTHSTHSTMTSGEKRKLLPLPWRGASSRGILLALLASLGYGLTFWVLGFLVTPGLGNITPVWFIRIVTPFILLLCSPLVKQPLTFPRGKVWLLLLAVGFFDTLAYIAYTSGMQPGQVSLVTMLSSLYSAVTVLLAWFFLRERLQRTQWLGILIIFVGIVLVNL